MHACRIFTGASNLSRAGDSVNKELLLHAEGFVELLVDSLLLDPEHPRKEHSSVFGETDWENAKAPVQQVRLFSAACCVPEPPTRAREAQERAEYG